MMLAWTVDLITRPFMAQFYKKVIKAGPKKPNTNPHMMMMTTTNHNHNHNHNRHIGCILTPLLHALLEDDALLPACSSAFAARVSRLLRMLPPLARLMTHSRLERLLLLHGSHSATPHQPPHAVFFVPHSGCSSHRNAASNKAGADAFDCAREARENVLGTRGIEKVLGAV